MSGIFTSVKTAISQAVTDLKAFYAESSGASLVGYIPAGTGAVEMNVQSKLRESVSVLDFGAVGDGVTDDSAAVQAAWDASSTIRIPSGTNCKISGVIAPQDGTILGDGVNSKITCNSGSAITSNYAGIDVLKIDGLHFLLSSAAIGVSIDRATLANVAKLTLTNNIFEATDNSNVMALQSSGLAGGLIEGNIVFGPSGYVSNMDAFVFTSDATHFNVNVNITNNYVYDIKTFVYAVNSSDDHFYANAGIRVINNRCLGLLGYGVYGVNGDWFQVEQNIFDYVAIPLYLKSVVNPKVKNNYFAANTDNYCINIETNSTVIMPNVEYVEIIGNRVFNYRKALGTGPGNDGIVLKATTHSMNQAQISGNTIDNCQTAINFNTAGLATVLAGNIRGNMIRSCDAGVNFGAQTAGNVVDGNSILDVGVNYLIGSTVQNSIGQNVFQMAPTNVSGRLAANGDGVTTVFSHVHSLTQSPNWANAILGTPTTGEMSLTYDATSVHFTITPAPAVGVNNVIVNWEVRTFQ